MGTERAGLVRPQADGWRGTVDVARAPGAQVVVAAPTLQAAQAAARGAAAENGWSPPFRWKGPDVQDVYELWANNTLA